MNHNAVRFWPFPSQRLQKYLRIFLKNVFIVSFFALIFFPELSFGISCETLSHSCKLMDYHSLPELKRDDLGEETESASVLVYVPHACSN